MTRPVIQDCDGLSLGDEEKAVFKDLDPFGFILFARNCDTPDQVRKLTDEMKQTVGRDDVPIFIDQEGGRVCRLNSRHWRTPPSGEELCALYERDEKTGVEASRINARLIAGDLRPLGITVNCAPLLDLRVQNTDPVIGDRSFGKDVEAIIKLGEAACEGLFDGGILPVIKHIPGHGRAIVDSHKALPIVDTAVEILQETDFRPFRALNYMPLAMTAHIVYSAIDGNNPATLSETVIRHIIRQQIGFEGVLISDDVSMKALTGKAAVNVRQALRAGCDLVLYCNASLAERREVLEALYEINGVSESWLMDMFRCHRSVTETDRAGLMEWLDDALEK